MRCEKCNEILEVIDVDYDLLEEDTLFHENVYVECYCRTCKKVIFLIKDTEDLTEEEEEWLGRC